jgi:hypothetical protein
LNLDDKGKITFDLTFYVDPTFINFEDTLAREGTASMNTMETGSEMPITSDNGATQ